MTESKSKSWTCISEPGDLVLEVNDVSFEGISNDDCVELFKIESEKPNPTIRIVIARPEELEPESVQVVLVWNHLQNTCD